MRIIKIKKQKNNKYQIEFDNKEKIITYDEVILKYNLLYKKELSESEIKDIVASNDYYDVYNEMIKYLTKKHHSKKECIEYLQKFSLKEKDRKRIISELEKINLINDINYTKAYVYDRFYLTNDGLNKIRKNLLNQNISEELIENELRTISYDDIVSKITKLIRKKLKTSKGSSFMIKQKIYNDLIMLGYDKNLIDNCFEIDIDDSNNLEKDFNKLFTQYSRKEKNSDKLYLKIKQKLYQKGYSLSMIDEIINKKV